MEHTIMLCLYFTVNAGIVLSHNFAFIFIVESEKKQGEEVRNRDDNYKGLSRIWIIDV